MRVHEAQKQLNITKEEIVGLLEKLGVYIKTTSQSIDQETFEKLKKAIKGEPKPPEEQQKEKTVEEAEEKTVEEPAEVEIEKKALEVQYGVTVKDFADKINVSPAEIIKKLFSLGEMVTINQQLSPEAISILGDELNYEVKIVESEEEELFEEELEEGHPEPRPPVVTVMGHVDHGKTSLLDAIRKSDVMSGEAGGITQHIGAYQVIHNDHAITFIDTPGHEAFTAMRARGAGITDVAILVVAADDGVKAQTVEAMNHAKAAGVPIVVAINKIDKPEANPDKVKTELSELGLVPEDWGGDTIFVEVSAKMGTNIDGLLEIMQLVADMAELKAPKDVTGKGIVIEAKLEKGRGPVTSVLIQRGTMNIGQTVLAGVSMGRIRALIDDKGRQIKKALPAQPVEIMGLSPLPDSGDEITVISDERKARQIIEMRRQKAKAGKQEVMPAMQKMHEMMEEIGMEELKIILKADVHGSLEAVIGELSKLSTEEVKVSVIHKGVGAITETDVMLAAASSALIFGFNVRPDVKAREMAEKEGVEIRLHKVIYQVIEDARNASLGLLKPQIEEEEVGAAEVRATFKVPKFGTAAGCYVINGEINKDNLVRLVRDGVVVYEGKIASLRRFKEDTTNVKTGYECGIGLENFKDIKEGDVIEAYRKVEKPRV